MIMLDRWKELAADSRMDKSTVEACQSLASEMCRDIFDRLGLDVQPIENALRVSGRGLTYVFPTGDKLVSSNALNPPRIKLPPSLKQVREGRPKKKLVGGSGQRPLPKGRGLKENKANVD
jgi:hypothetical protein